MTSGHVAACHFLKISPQVEGKRKSLVSVLVQVSDLISYEIQGFGNIHPVIEG